MPATVTAKSPTAREAEPAQVPAERSVMSPVPMPRETITHGLSLPYVRGLGRAFAGVAEVPDLDIEGSRATEKAEDIFWKHLRDSLNSEAEGEGPLTGWEETREKEQVVIMLHGVQVDEAEQIWREALERLNKGEGGPGIRVANPAFENANVLQGANVKAGARIALWPKDHLQNAEGWPIAPVRFRNKTSPGYVDLLEDHGTNPYFAGGWLNIPRGEQAEQFRIGGLGSLLSPGGVESLRQIYGEKKERLKTEFQRMLRNEKQNQNSHHKVLREIRGLLRRLRRQMKRLTTYEVGLDLVLCLLEAFHRQRDAWAKHELLLPGGEKISTAPHRLIYLDPQDLRIRIDPGRSMGQNWRRRLFSGLQALTTFERRTIDRQGNPSDVGDRMLTRLIDGLRVGQAEPVAQSGEGTGLIPLLSRSEVVPSDLFFVKLSVDFLERLVTWREDASGEVRWGMDAADAAKTKALEEGQDENEAKSTAREVRKRARNQPYYHHSPRLQAVGNLSGWPFTKRSLAYALLQETTPNRKGKKRRKNRLGGKEELRVFGGRDYVACTGQWGHGYRVTTWIEKAGYDRRSSSTAAEDYAEFVEDLQALVGEIDVRVRLKGQDMDTAEVLEALKLGCGNPDQHCDLVIKAYIPADLEDKLRERLAEEGIDGVDAGEMEDAPLTPFRLRTARKSAGLTQEDMASRIDVSQTTISLWETGHRPVPREKAELAAEVLDLKESS